MTSAVGSESRREFIEKIRRDRFGIGIEQSNPLAGMLHGAIVSLSAELYQKDIHFISELLQNAEDNKYFRGDTPSLELVLTTANITRESAPATLILFNNEVGFQEEHVQALCAVGMSTKKGRRNSGYIGEKGIGFKSVFLVTQTPYVISNGFRFRFTDTANNEAKIGYVVPEWVKEPIEDDLRRVYGKYELPQTMIILPLRPDKVDPVREQLKQISPETLLFLSKLRRLNVRQDSENSLRITRTDIPPTADEARKVMNVKTVELSVGGHVRNVSQYHLVQAKFPAPSGVEERKEVKSLDITIAFPVNDRINPGRVNGDIFAFLPSELVSGFPFVVNADFLLVSSRETLKFDSPWNKMILSSIPSLFFRAFVEHFLNKPNAVDVRRAYRYIPAKQVVHQEFQQVQKWILDSLRTEDCILIDSFVGYAPIPSEELAGGGCNMFCEPGTGRFITKEFRSILEAANAEGNPNPALRYLQTCIVDEELQNNYSETLQVLGVLEMGEEEYIEFLKHPDWLLKLNEELYWAVVFFALRFCMSSTSSGQMRAVPILKYWKGDGSIALASVQEAAAENGAKIYFSPSKEDHWLSSWISVFKPWVSLLFMPQNTVQTLGTYLQGKGNDPGGEYLKKVVLHLSVKSYLKQLLARLPTSTDRTFIILTTEFVYQSLYQPGVTMQDLKTCRYFPVIDDSAQILYVDQENGSKFGTYLLPAPGSMWTKLSLNTWSNDLVVMSTDYITIPSTWPPSLRAQLWDKEDPFELESYRNFLSRLLYASDIPHLTPWGGSRYRMPGILKSCMTIDQASLLLKWLTEILSRQSALDSERSHFVQTVKVADWLPTEHHGARRPSGCFDASSFSAFLSSSDIPCPHPSLAGFSYALKSLGVVTDPQKDCGAVGDFLFELADFNTWRRYSCNLGQASRLYKYLYRFHWNLPSSRTLKIFVPETTSVKLSPDSRNSWKDKELCVVQKSDDLFDDTLTILEDLYPKALLPFFSDVLKIPKQATVERYCQLWMRWRSNVHEITESECTCIWKILSEQWSKCDAKVRKNFIANAWVPSKSKGTDTFQLSAPRDCFIPDDLNLLSLFEKLPNVHFVWYPNNTEKMESGMNNVYSDMGVKNLSMSVQQQFIIGGENAGDDDAIQNQPFEPNEGILCESYRAILGFLAIKKYGLPSAKRQQLLSSLTDVVEVTITSPLTCVYTISSVSPPVVAKQDNIMAHWSRQEKKFYCVETDDPILRSALMRRDFRTHVAKAISQGILHEHPSIADDLADFLYVLISTGFDSSHVEYELRRKNARLFEEDEVFLSQLQI